MKINNLKNKLMDLTFPGFLVVLILIFFFIILGFSGMMAMLGIILLIIFPVYLILDNFDLDKGEKIVFSFFIGAAAISSLSYWIGMVISFRVAIFLSFIMLIAIGFLIKKMKNARKLF